MMTTARERRDQLEDDAAALRTQIRSCKRCNELRDKLHENYNESARLLPQAIEEVAAERGSVNVRRIKYSTNQNEPTVRSSDRRKNVSPPEDLGEAGGNDRRKDLSEPRRRRCSICNEPGHNSRTCTNGRKK